MKKIHYKGTHFIVTSDRIVTWLGRFVSLGNNAMAITLWPIIFVRPSTLHNEELLRHETIHIRQQLELLIVGAHLLYLFEYLYARFVKKFDKRQAYYYTATEQEAHRNAVDPRYLSKRPLFAVVKYIRDKKHLSRGENGELVLSEFKKTA